MRVYELARQLGMASKELVKELKDLGIQVKSHASAIDEGTAKEVTDLFSRPAPEPEQESAQEPREEKPTKPSRPVIITDPITVGELASRLELAPNDLIRELINEGKMFSINQRIGAEIATKIAEGHGFRVEVIPLYEEERIEEEKEGLREDLLPRPPVVTIMGHVDHGKTKLLDALRQTDVAGGEIGGITQHIGAYKIRTGEGEVAFLDTPGHEAFTAMRARGAQVTDIVVLVVAADDGIMPQTKEAISHARAAGVPIVVAINKIDLPTANIDRVKRQLGELDLAPEEWGGKTLFVEISAKERLNLDRLLESLLLEAEMLELKANPDRRASGTVIEARLDKGRGAVATFLVQRGTLKIGDPFMVGLHYGKVRAIFDDHGAEAKEAGPSTPVEVLGLSGVPQAGDTFQVVSSEKRAKEISSKRQKIKRETEPTPGKITLDELYKEIQEGKVKELNIIIKADVQGSVGALKENIEKLGTQEVRVRMIHGGAGGITESDVMLAAASNAIIVGFHVRPDPRARALAETQGVDIRLYQVIYEATQDVKKALEGLLEPKLKEHLLGSAEVRETFKISKVGVIAGCYVKEGKAIAGERARLVRDGVVVCEGRIKGLKRFKNDASEVSTGLECGVKLTDFNDIKVDDLIEIFSVEEIAQTL